MPCFVKSIKEMHEAPFYHSTTHIWLATREKGHSGNCVKCRLGLACAVRAGKSEMTLSVSMYFSVLSKTT